VQVVAAPEGYGTQSSANFRPRQGGREHGDKDGQKAYGRAQNILHVKLGGKGSTADEVPEKPKWMHWQTYSRSIQELRARDWNFMAALLVEGVGLSSSI
jgi:hypothetical protein